MTEVQNTFASAADGSAAPARPAEYSVCVVDFGSQYSQLITRRIRELGVYAELVPHDAGWDEVSRLSPRAVVLSGGPSSVYDDAAPAVPDWVLSQDVPVLAICYGLQALAQRLGGTVRRAEVREYGPATLRLLNQSPLFHGLEGSLPVWMSHGDSVVELPQGFEVLGSSADTPYAAVRRSRIFGLQFHPEVAHTPAGRQILSNFLFEIAQLQPNWSPGSFIDEAVEAVRAQVGAGRVLCALSGGVDSSVAAVLIHRAVGDRLTSVFVNNGLLRLGEAEQVVETFRSLGLPLVYADASDRFTAALRGVIDPEEKRIRVGETFIRVFEQEAARVGKVDFLAQGTLYPDVIESAAPHSKAAVKIKSHHNVGGLPADLQFRLVEPLRWLFKDEVRAVGRALGLPEAIVRRQPFPGPGLAVRIVGEVTPERLDVLRRADAVVRREIEAAGLAHELWQSFAVLTPVQTVGVMGDGRTYGYLAAVRAVTSEDAMTADWAKLPYPLLDKISTSIVNEVVEVTRVVYDITSKPPGTIEWE